MIDSLLVANRGEIAVRIMRTCRRLGIRTVAVYSDADRNAQHVALADAAVRIGPAPARESYLRVDAILDAARRTGAEGIHPGYGFLSEQPALAEACARAGLVFAGPSAQCIAAMGSKIIAKTLAARSGIPSVPGYFGDDQSDARLIRESHAIGLPVMVKASAGGGGKGMRRVDVEADLVPALASARHEAQAAFGDGLLLIEKLVARPRHLEVQIAGDKHGHVIHLFERDCSVQRHHQKLIEEAPAPNLDPAIRTKLLERAVTLARTIAYDNLGTVEFILEDRQTEPWFLEMNTRLQVEHPVTEAITGFDLVEWQLRIASGEPLPVAQADVRVYGHAIEARVAAELPQHDFRPDAGVIHFYREPSAIRVDSGVGTGSEVTLYYDSLLAKAIALQDVRDAARATLAGALREFAIVGPATTAPFLADALVHPIFAAGSATTGFIDDAFPQGWQPPEALTRLARAGAVVIAAEPVVRDRAASAWTALSGFRVLAPAGAPAQTHFVVGVDGGADEAVTVIAGDGEARIVRDPAGELHLRVRRTGVQFELEVEGTQHRGFAHRDRENVFVTLAGQGYAFRVRSAAAAASGPSGKGTGSGTIFAAVPGVVSEVKADVGEYVEAGQVVVMLESMKLLMSIVAETAGTVTDIACRPGETVRTGQCLVVIAPDGVRREAV